MTRNHTRSRTSPGPSSTPILIPEPGYNSPNAYGVPTKATATEVMNLRDYTESEYGRHAMIKDNWVAQIVRVFLRAIVASMEAPLRDFGMEYKRELHDVDDNSLKETQREEAID